MGRCLARLTLAYWKLVHRLAPLSMARAVRLVGLVVSPPEISYLAKVVIEIRKWEIHQSASAKDIRKIFPDTVKVGILLEMLPQQAHDFVLQTLGNEVEYEETAERVRAFVARKLAIASGSGLATMDMGHAQAESCGDWEDEEEWDDEVGVRSMSSQCHACHGTCAPRLSHGRRQPERLTQGKKKGKRANEGRRQRRQDRGQDISTCYTCQQPAHMAAN